MLTPVQSGKTLRDLREEHNLDHQALVDAIGRQMKAWPKHWTASANYERRGLQNVEVMGALAKIYGLTIEEVAEAARNSKAQGIPPAERRNRQK